MPEIFLLSLEGFREGFAFGDVTLVALEDVFFDGLAGFGFLAGGGELGGVVFFFLGASMNKMGENCTNATTLHECTASFQLKYTNTL